MLNIISNCLHILEQSQYLLNGGISCKSLLPVIEMVEATAVQLNDNQLIISNGPTSENAVSLGE